MMSLEKLKQVNNSSRNGLKKSIKAGLGFNALENEYIQFRIQENLLLI